MSESSTGNGASLWLRIGLALIPFVLAGIVAFATMQSNVQHLSTTVQTKASKETVEAQLNAILRELQSINQRLDRMAR